jgi:spore coat protein A
VELNRRDLIKLGLFGTAALMLPAERIARAAIAQSNRIPESQLPPPFSVGFRRPPVLDPVRSDATADYYSLVQMPADVEILPGLQTQIWGYNGISPGPTIMATKGRPTVVRQACALPEFHPTLRYRTWTSTHLHGSATLPQYDGYANDITLPEQYKDYHYPQLQRARTLWYHDHGYDITSENIYMGLDAMYIVHDDDELATGIPQGAYDVPVVITDALFEKSGALIYGGGDEGLQGDVILVNGVPWPAMAVEPRKYRFRFLNASISRSYVMALDSREPLTVVGTDAGLMPAPQQVAAVKIGMAERYEIVIDFAGYQPGQRVVLKNLGTHHSENFRTTGVIMAFDVGANVTDATNNDVPSQLVDSDVMGLTEADAKTTRRMVVKRQHGHWVINGRIWEDVINSDFKLVLANPAQDDVEIWELVNDSGGWFHPVHIHLVDVKILDRNGRPPFDYERGPKDVVYVGEDETVRVIMRFEHHTGRYMMHCHNAVHEDHAMMQQFEVGAGGPDPISTDPARNLPAPAL